MTALTELTERTELTVIIVILLNWKSLLISDNLKVRDASASKNQLMHFSCFAVPLWASSCSPWLIFSFQISTHRRVQKRQTTYDRFPAIWNSLLVLCRALLLCSAMLLSAPDQLTWDSSWITVSCQLLRSTTYLFIHVCLLIFWVFFFLILIRIFPEWPHM